MSAYRICEECGAALDPGERCDCQPQPPVKLIKPGGGRAGLPCERCGAPAEPSECRGPVFYYKGNTDTSGTGGGT